VVHPQLFCPETKASSEEQDVNTKLKMTRLTLGAHLARIKTARAAVVPYTILRDDSGRERLHFMFARDQESGEITDLGGGVKQYEFSLSAGLREFREESDEIFGALYDNINDLSLQVALVGERMSVLFIPLSPEWYSIAPEMFQEKRKSPPHSRSRKRSHNEVSELLWIDEVEFKRLISPRNKQMWGMLKRFYQRGYNDDVRKALKVAYAY
jgi:hypothetical protein